MEVKIYFFLALWDPVIPFTRADAHWVHGLFLAQEFSLQNLIFFAHW